jgi:hypothetical protein
MIEDPIFWILAAPGLLLGLYAQSKALSRFDGLFVSHEIQHLLATEKT